MSVNYQITIRRISVIIVLIMIQYSAFNIQNSYAQRFEDLHTKSSKAIKLFKKSVAYMDKGEYAEAEKALLNAIQVDENFIDAYQLLAQDYEHMKKIEKAKEQYYKVIEMDPQFFPNNYSFLGELEMSTGNYEKALVMFNSYLNEKTKKSYRLEDLCKTGLKTCEFAIKAIANPVPFDPVNLGGNINTENAEYLPAITADEKMMIITSKIPIPNAPPKAFRKFQEDFFISFKRNGEWQKAFNLGKPINTSGNEGAQCISPDGQYIFFTACERRTGYGSCDIYVSKIRGTRWSDPVNLGIPVNTSRWESQPSISSDGKALYFSSNRRGGLGDTDIWVSEFQPNGEWGRPYNLGDKINTTKSEQSPFIHPDNQTLYFSSSGLVGMGGFDVFYSRKNEKGEWGEPVNIGYPINTYHNETSLIVSTNGKLAYFSSSRFEGFGDMDLYKFDLYEGAQPIRVTYVKGNVFDKITRQKLDARFEFIDVESGKKAVESYSNEETGEFFVCLTANKDYVLNVSRKDYLFYSESFFLKQAGKEDAILMDIALEPIEVGGVVVLKNIFFATGSYVLKDKSKVELNKLVAYLKEYPTIKIEIGGHTDNVGNIQSNIVLSDNRAKAVYNYLINVAVSSDRLTYKGYGQSKPIAANDTEIGRAKNRRTEFIIIEK